MGKVKSTTYKHFKDKADFNVHDFNEFSNHAPLTFALNANNLSDNGENNPRIHFAWKSEFKDQFLQDIAGGVQDLEHSLQSGVNSNFIGINIDLFSQYTR